MIISIQKGTYIKGIIRYHEKKIEKGRADLLYDNTLSENGRERIKAYLDTAQLNPRIYRNKFMHISVSFNLEDRLIEPERMVDIAQKYLDKMEFVNTPVLIYQHDDKKHKHFHIVTTTMDYDGKKLPDFNDHYRSQQLARALEKEFHLVPTTYERREDQKLQEINATRYKIYNALGGLTQAPRAKAEIDSLISQDLQIEIKDNMLSDYQIGKKLKERGKAQDSIHQIYRVLTKANLIETTLKQELINQLQQIKLTSNSREEYLAKLQDQGLYARKISGRGESLVYGISEKNFYVKEKDLPTQYRYDFLFTGKAIERSFDTSHQKNYLKRIVTKSLRESTNLEEFELVLKNNNVTVEFAKNSSGIYGISFSSDNVTNPVTFKGSELDRNMLTWSKIQQALDPKTKVLSPKTERLGPTKNVAPALRGVNRIFDSPDDETTKKRKGNDQNQDLERD